MSLNDAQKVYPAQNDSLRSKGLDRLIRALLTIDKLNHADQDAIRALPGQIRKMAAYEDVVSEGDSPKVIAVLVDGFACRYKMLEDGRRQILSFLIAGDAPDVQSLHIDKMDHNVGTLAASTVLHIRHDIMLDLFAKRPALAGVFWRWTLIEAAVFREWVTNIGQREAYQRMAHLFCELISRSEAVGLVEGNSCEFPITQVELADTTGLSPVHVNRTLQALRAEKLIQLKSGALTVLDWKGLQKAGGFDPAYLHLRSPIT